MGLLSDLFQSKEARAEADRLRAENAARREAERVATEGMTHDQKEAYWAERRNKGYEAHQEILRKRAAAERAAERAAKEAKIARRDAAIAAGEKPRHVVAARTPKWIRDTGAPYHLPKEKARLEYIKKLAREAGKDHDHNIPRRGLVASGLDVPDNVSAMDRHKNRKVKSNRLPDDFLDFEWKTNPRTGRMDGYRRVDGKLQRVPRSQGGYVDPGLLGATEANAKRVKNFARGAGKVGLLGAAEMALNYLAPDNPLNQARDYGYGSLKNMGLDIEGGIGNIENPLLRGSAHLANGLLADPLVTAFGAGNWVGDRIQQELRGEHSNNQLSRGDYGMMGRFNKGLLNG